MTLSLGLRRPRCYADAVTVFRLQGVSSAHLGVPFLHSERTFIGKRIALFSSAASNYASR
jgi:hypothetical protein